tara:strand:+ start:958 stop:2010 length:1053 start_codon:yes stop_codon:yes gene_type:complete
MKNFFLIFYILVLFIKTGNVLSQENIFNVNNIEIFENTNQSSSSQTNMAIIQAFDNLKKKILLDEDIIKLSNLEFRLINDLVSYYQVASERDNEKKKNKKIYNISFDKDKIHDLFYKMGISYSEILNKELYLLPVLKKDDQIYVYNQNFYYNNWRSLGDNDLIEFILPLENIEIIQKINSKKNNLSDINLKDIFQEYTNKNLALVLIEENKDEIKSIYLKTNILGKSINKNLIIKKMEKDDSNKNSKEKLISYTSEEIISLIKSQNLIDIRTPSFLNTKFKLSKNNNLFELNQKLKKIDLIDNIYVIELNNEYAIIKIKYLGKLNKIVKQLENQEINLSLKGEEWQLNIL